MPILRSHDDLSQRDRAALIGAELLGIDAISNDITLFKYGRNGRLTVCIKVTAMSGCIKLDIYHYSTQAMSDSSVKVHGVPPERNKLRGKRVDVRPSDAEPIIDDLEEDRGVVAYMNRVMALMSGDSDDSDKT